MRKIISILLCVNILGLLLTTGCTMSSKETFYIVSGSENETLEPLIEQFADENNVHIEMVYKGSVDIMNMLPTDEINNYDAVWPANSMWISIGDEKDMIKHTKSIMTSPVVFGIKESLAEELGFIGEDVAVGDILAAINAGDLNFMMTSATQSNSGACAYIGFVNALLGNPSSISMEDLENEELKENITDLLLGINRSSGSSGWLKELFLSGDYDAMVNYEALIIEANQELESENRETLHVIYPTDGLALADSPLGYVNKGEDEKEELFLALQEYLLSDEVQEELTQYGRRTGIAGVMQDVDDNVFREDWGIDVDKTLSYITMPSASVIMEALYLYQNELRKPSFTVFCLDYSGSMYGEGEDEMKEAMSLLLDIDKSTQYMIQPSDEDIIVVVPFNHEVIDMWYAEGTNTEQLDMLLNRVNDLDADGGTDIYAPSMYGLEIILENIDISKYSPAVVLLTDGESYDGYDFHDFEDYYEDYSYDIPVFSIMFGDADEDQLEEIAELTRARVFDGKDDLVSAFKKVKGYN